MCISTYAIFCFIFSSHGGFPIAAKSTSIICSCAVVPTAVAWCWIVCCAPRVAGIKLESELVHIMLKLNTPGCHIHKLVFALLLHYLTSSHRSHRDISAPRRLGLDCKNNCQQEYSIVNHSSHIFAKCMAIAISP